MDTIRKMIEDAVARTIGALLTDETPIASRADAARTIQHGQRTIAANVPTARVEAIDGDVARVTRRRRRRHVAASVAYVVNKRDGRKAAPELFETASIVYAALSKAKGPLSNRQLEAVTGLKKKTVESCVWYLRRHAADGTLVPAGKRALIASVAAE